MIGSRGDRRTGQRGASAVEYGLLIAGIAAVVAIAVYAVGQASAHQMSNSCDTVGGHIQTSLAEAGSGNGEAPDCGD